MTALEKAQAMHRHCQHLGIRGDDVVIPLTPSEAFEFLDHLATLHYERQDLLLRDIAQAKKQGDPWPVLNGFTVLGFPVVPLQ